MSDELTDDQVALLCSIGEFDWSKATTEKRRHLERLTADGYVQPAGKNPASPVELTAKGVTFLGKRGAGLNEA